MLYKYLQGKQFYFFVVFLVGLFYASFVYAQPELPRVYVDTTMPSQSGTIRLVNPTDCNNPSTGLQAQLNAAQRGDIIEIPANLTCKGSYTFPVKSGNGWIIVRTSGFANLPEGKRVNPSQSQLMPKILSTGVNPAIIMPSNASYYRLIGLEISIAPDALEDADQGGYMNYQLVSLGDSTDPDINNVAHHIIIDRCYIHGLTKKNVKRGIMMGSTYTAVIDSYISEIHAYGLDTQAIASWSSPGPLKIVNNYLEAAGENILFGGADTVHPNLVPSDIEIRNNYFYKPFAWKLNSGNTAPSGACLYDSRYPSDGENYALEDSGGNVIDWYKCVNGAWVRTGTKPDSVSIKWGLQAWPVKNLFEIKNGRRVIVEGNVLENNWISAQSGAGILFTVRAESNSGAAVEDITFRKNIMRRSYQGVNMLGHDDINPQSPSYTKNVLIQDNLFEQIGIGAQPGTVARAYQILYGVQGLTINHNTLLGDYPTLIVADGDPTPNMNFTNNIQFYGQYGIAGMGNLPNSTIVQNVFIAAPAGQSKLYPSTGYFWPATASEVGFVNYNNGIGGDYRLSSASPYKNLGTDGKDIGADINAIMAATAGVTDGTNVPAPTPTPTPTPTPAPTSTSVVCTSDVKLCPDGKTYVSRIPPSCEFASCPISTSTSTPVSTSTSVSILPSPTNLVAFCSPPGTTVSLSWSPSSGATSYALRVDNQLDGWTGTCASSAGDFCATTTLTTYSFSPKSGATYKWWVYAANSKGLSNRVNGPDFTCVTPTSTFTFTPAPIISTSTITQAPTPISTPILNFTSLNCSQYSSEKDKLMCNYFNTLLQLYTLLIKLLQAKIPN